MPVQGNAFVDLLCEIQRRYTCTKLSCSTCGGIPRQQYWALRAIKNFLEVEPETARDALRALTPGEIVTLPHWKTALVPALESVAASDSHPKLNEIVKAWAECLGGYSDFAFFVSQEILYRDYRLSKVTKSGWVLAALRSAVDDQDSDLIRLLLERHDRDSELILHRAIEIAFTTHDPELVLQLLKREDLWPGVRRGLIELVIRHAIADLDFELRLTDACQNHDAELTTVLTKVVPENLRFAKLIGDGELAFRIGNLANVSSDLAEAACDLAIDIACERETPDLAIKILHSDRAAVSGRVRLIDKLLSFARRGDQRAIREMAVFVEYGEEWHSEIRRLNAQLDADLASAEQRRAEEEQRLASEDIARRERECQERRTAQRQRQAERNELRLQLLSRLADALPDERLKFIAGDETHAINFFPADWANVDVNELVSLPHDTLRLLDQKLVHAHPGPWRQLRRKIRDLDLCSSSVEQRFG